MKGHILSEMNHHPIGVGAYLSATEMSNGIRHRNGRPTGTILAVKYATERNQLERACTGACLGVIWCSGGSIRATLCTISLNSRIPKIVSPQALA
jgi:hypothetical protein